MGSEAKVMRVERPQALGPGYEKGDLRIVELSGALRIPRAYHDALLDALLRERGYQKRWALIEAQWGHVHSRAWFDTPEKVDQYRRDTGIRGRCRPIYVPVQQGEEEP